MSLEEEPKFPIRVTWHKTGEVDEYEDIGALSGTLEEFDTAEDWKEASVSDSRGRPVFLKLKNWKNKFEMRLFE